MLRNILLFICQVLIISLCALMLAQPFIDQPIDNTSKKVYIIDASASMTTHTGGITRFERAIEEVRNAANQDLEKEDSEVSIIIAHDTASYLIERADHSTKGIVDATLGDLLSEVINGEKQYCTYGTPDIAGAVKLSEQITSVTPDVQVVLYTDSIYIDADRIKVVSVVDPSEWNAAILDVRATIVENKYNIEVDVATYGVNRDISVTIEVSGTDVNGAPTQFSLTSPVLCDDGEVETLVFSSTDDDSDIKNKMSSLAFYSSVYVYHSELDSFDHDNSFYLYGGTKPTLRIQYASPMPNKYFSTALFVLRDRLKYRWNIEYKEVKGEEEPAMDGYDVYIFEHVMPDTLPTDGVVFLVNPDYAPLNSGFSLGGTAHYPESQPLAVGEDHEILNMISAETITLTKYSYVSNYDLFTPILTCNDDPVLLIKNEPDEKVVLMPFSLNYSNLPVLLEFPLLMYNLVEYYLPSTISQFVFDINETISLNSRGEDLTVVGAEIDQVFTEFPSEITLSTPGVYTLTYTPISGKTEVETFYVKLPGEESNIYSSFDGITNPYYFVQEENTTNQELLFYFAIALVALFFIEWWLHNREHKN